MQERISREREKKKETYDIAHKNLPPTFEHKYTATNFQVSHTIKYFSFIYFTLFYKYSSIYLLSFI